MGMPTLYLYHTMWYDVIVIILLFADELLAVLDEKTLGVSVNAHALSVVDGSVLINS